MYPIEVIRSRRKTMSLEVTVDGRVLLRAPLRCSAVQIRDFADRHRLWIERRLRESEQYRRIPVLSEEEVRHLQNLGRTVFAERTEHFARRMGVTYGRISVRKQRTKWGSCSAQGNLSFNCLLLLAPPDVLDYVVVHELCHRLEMNHSARFWALVQEILPDYEQSRRYLRDNGSVLMARLPEKL